MFTIKQNEDKTSRDWSNTNQLFDQVTARCFPSCPEVLQSTESQIFSLYIHDEEQLWCLAVKTAAALILWGYRCPRVRDVRAGRDQIGHKSNPHALRNDQFCGGLAHLERAYCHALTTADYDWKNGNHITAFLQKQ